MRLKYIFLLLLPSFTFAQITHRNFLEQSCPPERLKQVLRSQSDFHPFPQTPAKWKEVLADSVIQRLIRSGEDALKENFPNIPATVALDFIRNGNRTRYENILFGKRNRLWNLVLAESIEGKKRFMDAIVDGIWSISEETFWGTSAHLFIQKTGPGLPDVEDPVIDLFAAETAANLAYADYFVGPQLDSISPLIRQRIYYEVNRRVFTPIQSAKYEWMGKGDTSAKLNNWSVWIMNNYLASVLCLEKDLAKRVQYVSKAMQLTDQYINSIGDKGSCEEGPHYWNFGHGCVLDILQMLGYASNNQVNIYDKELIRNMGAYIYRVHIDGYYFVNVADSHPEVYPEPIMIWRFGQQVKDPNLSNLGAWLFRKQRYFNTINSTFHRTRALFDLLSLGKIAAHTNNYQPGTETWLPDVQLMTARLPNGLFVAAHGGHNGESHNHNDVGDFIIYAGGDPVIIDVGSGTYTSRTFSKDRYKLWFNASAHHNLPTINGQQQEEGEGYLAQQVSYTKEKDRTVLSMNIEKAYPVSAGLASWKRMITTDSKQIVIDDNFKTIKSPASLTQSFMTVCEVDINQPGLLIFTTAHGRKVSLRYEKAWQATKETIPLSTEEEQGLKYTWKNQPITRVLLTLKSPASSRRFQYTITLSDKN